MSWKPQDKFELVGYLLGLAAISYAVWLFDKVWQ